MLFSEKCKPIFHNHLSICSLRQLSKRWSGTGKAPEGVQAEELAMSTTVGSGRGRIPLEVQQHQPAQNKRQSLKMSHV